MSYTRQEIFDIVLTQMRKQKAQSTNDYSCVYRSYKDGQELMCAAGPFIIPENFTPLSDENSLTIDSLRKKNPRAIIPDAIEHIPFIKKLQSIHDSWEECSTNLSFIEHIETEMQFFASDYDLKYES